MRTHLHAARGIHDELHQHFALRQVRTLHGRRRGHELIAVLQYRVRQRQVALVERAEQREARKRVEHAGEAADPRVRKDEQRHAQGLAAAGDAFAERLTDHDPTDELVVCREWGDEDQGAVRSDLDRAELLVVGNVGVKGLGRVLGSVAWSVVHNAPCDVLVVKTAS